MKANQAYIVTGSGEVYLADILEKGKTTSSVLWHELDGEKRSFRANSELYPSKKLAIKNSRV